MLTTFYFIYLLDMDIATPLDRPDVSLLCFSIGANCRSHVCANMYVLVCDGEKKTNYSLINLLYGNKWKKRHDVVK